MSENKDTDSNTGKKLEHVDVILYGDKENCGKCADGDKDLSEKTKNSRVISYHYKDIYSDEGQEYLRKKGVKEGDNVNIPYIKACKVELDGDQKKKKCAEVNEYQSDSWKSLENDELPSDLKFELDE